MVFFENSYLTNFFNEADETTDDSVAETNLDNDSKASSENKDIDNTKNDTESEDVTADSDVDTPTESDSTEDSTTETDGTDNINNSTDSTDTTTSTVPPYEEDTKNKEKKLLLFTLLNEIRNSFKSVSDVLDLILSNTLHHSNVLTIKNVRQKILTNINLLNDLLSDVNISKNRTADDLEKLYDLYLADYKNVEIFVKQLDKSIPKV
ncbi:MAG: hypothetical protein [Bacteriophage sp.]|nr:MAG: hypothetical protein [Bacteriophage sp.]